MLFNTLVHIIGVSENPFYESCTNEYCKKKVLFDEEKKYFYCKKCSMIVPEPIKWLFGHIRICDDNNDIEVLIAGEQICHELFNMSEKELYENKSIF